MLWRFTVQARTHRGGVVTFDTQISHDTLGNRENPIFSIKFDRFSWKINGKSWILTISQGVVGNLGVARDHPPKMCARLLPAPADPDGSLRRCTGKCVCGTLALPEAENAVNYARTVQIYYSDLG